MPINEDLFLGLMETIRESASLLAIPLLLPFLYFGTRWVHQHKPHGQGGTRRARGDGYAPSELRDDERTRGFVIGTTRRLTRVNPTIDLSLAHHGLGISVLSLSGWRPMIELMDPARGRRLKAAAQRTFRRMLSQLQQLQQT